MRVIPRVVLPAIVFAMFARAQDAAFTPEWDIGAILKEISAHAGRLVQMLDKVNPSGWVAKGAPDTYVAQWKSARAQAVALGGDALELSRNPEQLPAALKTFFRMQSLEFMVASISEGTRRYQNPAVAELLSGMSAENGANRERFQRYIVELASQREQEYKIMDHEAQRCRGMLSREIPAKKAPARKQQQP